MFWLYFCGIFFSLGGHNGFWEQEMEVAVMVDTVINIACSSLGWMPSCIHCRPALIPCVFVYLLLSFGAGLFVCACLIWSKFKANLLQCWAKKIWIIVCDLWGEKAAWRCHWERNRPDRVETRASFSLPPSHCPGFQIYIYSSCIYILYCYRSRRPCKHVRNLDILTPLSCCCFAPRNAEALNRLNERIAPTLIWCFSLRRLCSWNPAIFHAANCPRGTAICRVGS